MAMCRDPTNKERIAEVDMVLDIELIVNLR